MRDIPKILLLGDSICQGYSEYVRNRLLGVARVYFVGDNGRFTTYLLKYLHTWAENLSIVGNVDIVHFNAGLWDVLRIDGDTPLVDLPTYEKNLTRIIRRIRYVFPYAHIVFAMTTSVIDDKMPRNFCRHNADVVRYNQKAAAIMERERIEIDDLYELTSKETFTAYENDGIHFTKIGYQAIGKYVIRAIMKNFPQTYETRQTNVLLQMLRKVRCFIYGYGKCGRYVAQQIFRLNGLVSSGGGYTLSSIMRLKRKGLALMGFRSFHRLLLNGKLCQRKLFWL